MESNSGGSIVSNLNYIGFNSLINFTKIFQGFYFINASYFNLKNRSPRIVLSLGFLSLEPYKEKENITQLAGNESANKI